MATLNYDAQGFIVGLGRIERHTSNVHDDTQEIIRILKGQRQLSDTRMQEMANNLRQINQSTRLSSRIHARPGSNNSGSGQVTRSPSHNASTLNAQNRMTRRASEAVNDSSNTAGRNRQNQTRSSRNSISRDSASRQNRDNLGRFTTQADNANFINRLSDKIGDKFKSNLDTENIDPLLQSVKEVKGLLSPVTGLFSILTGGRDKPSRYERQRDRDAQNSLDHIEDAVRHGGSGSSGSGLLGGLAGRALGGAGGLAGSALGLLRKGGGKFLGPLAAIIGAGSLAMDWDNLDHKGKSAGVGGLAGSVGGAATGAMVGTMIFPGVGTVVGGVLGGWLGKEGGEALGKTASPYIQSWTQGLTAANIPKKFSDTFSNGLQPFFDGAGKVWDWVKEKANNIGTSMTTNDDGSRNIFGQAVDGAVGFYENITGGGGNPAPKAAKAADYAVNNALSGLMGRCAEFVNNAFQAQGLKAWGNGKDVAGNLIKGNAGKFQQVPYSENYVPQIGDVMSMEANDASNGARQSKKYGGNRPGHVAIYTKDGWVSDGKQGRRFGNTGAANQAYYDGIKSGVNKVTIARMTNPNGDSSVTGGRVSGMLAKGNNSQYDNLIMASSLRNGVDPAFMKAMMHEESHFNPNARSKAGAQGLIQLMPGTFKQYSRGERRNALNPADNIEVAARYTKHLQDKFNGNKALMAAAYNAGEYRDSLENGQIPNIPETRNHVKKVMSRYNQYKGTLSSASPIAGNVTTQTGRRSSKMPTIPKVAIPPAPKIAQKLNTDKPSMVIANNQDILPQNVSDRLLAHAITGGLGEDRWLG